VRERLGGYARLEIEPRREAVLELKGNGLNNYEIADVLGVDERTVRRDEEAANAERHTSETMT
jgi:DNA-binding NarL/FixJ family response regulator